MKSKTGSLTCDELCALAVDWGDVGPDAEAPDEPSDLDAARAHLSDCPACRRLLVAQGEARRRLRPLAAAMPPTPPTTLEVRLGGALAARQTKTSVRWRRPTRVFGVVAMALAASAAGYLLLAAEKGRTPGPTEPVAGRPAASEVTRDLQAPGAPRRGDPERRYRPLGWLEGERPLEGARVARVEMRAEVAAAFGWPLTPDLGGGRVQADILYGEDGLARAVRFIPASFRMDAQEGTSP